jgi:hypothetical protein
MCPREYPLFPVFQRFPQYYGFRDIFPISEIVFTLSEIICPLSVIYVTYPVVELLCEYSTTSSGVLLHPMFIHASCHAPVSLSAVGVRLGGSWSV